MEEQKYDQVLHDIGDMIVKKEKKKREASKLVVINEEELIRQVEMRPILFDKSLKGYRKSALRDQSWKEIATLLGSTVEECRKRWRSLRDAFSKHYKQLGGALNSKKKKWLFYDQMYFLAPYLDCGSNIQDSSGVMSLQETSHESIMELDVEECINMSEVEKNDIREDEQCQSTQPQEEQTIDDENQFMTRIFTSPSDYQSADVQDIKKCSSEQGHDYQTIATTDPDERFLLSCSPILKRLSNKKNALARLRIQQILYSIEFGEQ